MCLKLLYTLSSSLKYCALNAHSSSSSASSSSSSYYYYINIKITIAIVFVCLTDVELSSDYLNPSEYLNLNLKCPGRAASPIP